MSDALDIRVEWLDGPGVTTPELAATWARYEIWVDGRCVTQVEAPDGTLRRSVYGSMYPLAEWIATNWWVLASHIRPSATETRYWTWPNIRAYPWLAHHNLRGAGDGMAWPNLTLVPEGAVTYARWAPDVEYARRPVRFASDGMAVVRTAVVTEGLAEVVNRVLERLSEEGLPKTGLADEWESIAATDEEEREFCRIAARLGLDPYSVTEDLAASIMDVAVAMPAELVHDFFDSADITALPAAAKWTRRAIATADRASSRARESLKPLYSAIQHHPVESFTNRVHDDLDRPWLMGYAMARQVRSLLSIGPKDDFDASPWVGVGELKAPSAGIQGIATVRNGRCGLVLGMPRVGISTNRFGQARALGRVLTRPQQGRFVLSQARGHDERVAGAFAAELLAPAEGVRQLLSALGKSDDTAMEAVAHHYKVSPLLVRHQYDNQIAKPADRYWSL